IVLAPADTNEELRQILAAVAEGRMPVETLRDRVGRILFYKYMLSHEDYGHGNIADTSEAERIIKLLR
ncbi:MAG: hypothetical protein K2M16_09265, partial [Muribaculaceae bacterium]|nr:hypothetical protein [Muribaculaceae bacterium]